MHNKIDAFVATVLTEERLKQGVSEVCRGLYQVCSVGALMTWVQRQVQTECQPELKAAGLFWEQVQKPLLEATRQWYLDQI